jgi:acetamidase/formamidase
MGFHEDLDEAMKIAARHAVQFLVKTKGLTPNDAYAIASMAVDFRVTQIVDGNKGIHAMIPKAIFKKKD